MKADNRFEIDVFKLREGQHTYDFEVEQEFFDLFENSPVAGGNGVVQATLDKQERMILVTMEIRVAVPLECDKTLKPFDHPIEEVREVMYKYGETEEELDDDLFMITKNTQRIDLTQLLYEYICMAVPMRKIHPDHQDESEEDEVVYSSSEQNDTPDDDAIDPRWSKLKDLN